MVKVIQIFYFHAKQLRHVELFPVRRWPILGLIPLWFADAQSSQTFYPFWIMDFSLELFVAFMCEIATLRQVGLVLAPHHFFPSPAPKYTLCPLPKLGETVHQTSGFAQMCRSFRTVALDLARRPRGPDTCLKWNYRLVATGSKKGVYLVGPPSLWELLILSIRTDGKQKKKKKSHVMGFQKENAVLEDFLSSECEPPSYLQRPLNLTL